MSTVDASGFVTARAASDPAAVDRSVRRVDEVFCALGAAVHGYLRASGVSDSENLLGDVFLRVARALPRFTGGDDDLRRWVFTIAHHCLVDERRRAARERAFLHTLKRRHRATPARPPDDPVDPKLVAALADLTPEQRQVVTLRFVADLSLEDVAGITGRPAGAVKSLQHRALRALSVALSDPGAAPPPATIR